MNAKYMWLDLETTGLDASKDQILECAAVATDQGLAVVGEPFHAVLRCDPLGDVRNTVRKMHAANGLWLDCMSSSLREGDLDSALTSWMAGFTWEHKPILAGATIHFDRRFIEHRLPFVAERLHYRMLDVRSVTMLSGAEGLPVCHEHRAMADVLTAIEQARELQRRRA